MSTINLFWIPLGAGGNGFVRFNGLVYEWARARLGGRSPLDLYHTALEVTLPGGRYIVENAWPSPDADTASRGVLCEGPVFNRRLARFRPFRYEVRCWRDGVISDANMATEVQVVSRDVAEARRLLDLVSLVPPMIWGRRQVPKAGEMWNSNSVVSFLLTLAGIGVESIHPPLGGRAPGWDAGILGARQADVLINPYGAKGLDDHPPTTELRSF